ncbi:hypothetical protein SAMN04489712_102550 [Thermomonospora echinospora]|uniref:Uncharacterized protein n=1 Tax=Thermomonospora echinospora TaxID=1992 RepID=A0A1H5W1M0_9ACTN|nr:hypothetical protein [Thermomonospora echinospora]SEF93178.1 hypothetical protein SAMN04489712_102550 [Thermomonospora echinospora]
MRAADRRDHVLATGDVRRRTGGRRAPARSHTHPHRSDGGLPLPRVVP